MAGPWDRYRGMTQQNPSLQVAPPDPRLPYQVQRDRNAANASEFDAQIAQARAQEAQAQARMAEIQLQQGGGTPEQRQQMATRRANMVAASEQLLHLGNLYRNGFQGGGAFDSMLESLPDFASPGNSSFNSAASGLSEAAFAALRVPGVGTQSDAELRQFLRANEPRAQSYDTTIETRLDTVQRRLNAQRQEMGLPPLDWRARPGDEMTAPERIPLVVNPQQPGRGLAGGEVMETRRDPVLEQIGGRMSRMITDGATPGQVYEYLRSVGMDPARDARLRQSVTEAIRFRRSPEYRRWQQANPGKSYPIAPEFFNVTVPQSGLRQGISSLSQSPAGAFGIAAGQAVTGNRLDDAVGWTGGDAEMARAGIEAVRDENPVSSMAGDIVGQGVAMYGAGGVGRAVASRLPAATQAGVQAAMNPFTRTAGRQALAGDALYGAYAGSGDDNLIGGTAMNVIGGRLGSAATRGAGLAVGGARDLAVRELTERGIPLTIGDIAGQSGLAGRVVRGIERRAAGYPVVGDMIAGQYRQGLEGGVQAAHQEVLDQIGGRAGPEVGEQAIDSTLAQVNQAFRNATQGVNLNRDRAFNSGWNAVRRSTARPAVTTEVREIVDASLAQIDELFAGRQLSGERLNDALQILGEARARVAGLPADRAGLSALRKAEQVLVGMARRQAPQVMPALNQARQAYRRFAVVRDATRAAAGDANGVFTPLQLTRADVNNTTSFGGRNASASTQRPFFALTDAMRQVMPNRVPDSGTAGRAALGAGALVGVGAGSDAAGFTDNGAQNAAMLAGLAAAPYTNLGRQAFQTALVRRPELARRAGDFLIDNEWMQRMARLVGASQLPYHTTEGY